MAQTAPLAGLKVLDFTWVMAGPAAIRYLVDHGATVVHIESATRIDTARTLQPFKDGQNGPERSGLFANMNAGKMSLSLNLAHPAAREAVRRLVQWADVLTESYSPKAMKGFGFDYDAVKQINPSIIMLSSCLNGQYGPESKLAGFGTMGAQLAGFGELAGWPDRPPAGPFGAYTDYIAPKFTVAALLSALEYRRRTGKGQYIDLSQSEASTAFLGPALLNYTVNRTVDGRAGNSSPEQCPHGVFPCAGEDKWIAIAAATDGEFAALARATGNVSWLSDPRFATLAARFANRVALEEALSAWTSACARDEAETALVAAGVPAHRVAGSADATVDPQLQHRRHFRTVTYGEVGEVPVEGSRFALSRTPAREPGSPPQLGEHNQQVLADILGMSEEEIIDLVVAGALE
jgi:crotonobetainyl-CoA:carnitine CoA-transferase CaiB-like acyl-CoA transferase